MSCKICCWIRNKWFTFTGVNRLQNSMNAMMHQERRMVTTDYAKLINGLETQLVEFRRAVKEHLKKVDNEIHHNREWADAMAEAKVTPQRDRIVDAQQRIKKLADSVTALDEELSTVAIRLDALETPKPKKIGQ